MKEARSPSPEPSRTSQARASSCCPSEASTTACIHRTRRSAGPWSFWGLLGVLLFMQTHCLTSYLSDTTTSREPSCSSHTCMKCLRSRSRPLMRRSAAKQISPLLTVIFLSYCDILMMLGQIKPVFCNACAVVALFEICVYLH